ncbi:hypothetical protein CO667_11890 [Rhizobium sp. L43]|nr:hypothetical protein CO667_11890 [Rhizobium sp. L43]
MDAFKAQRLGVRGLLRHAARRRETAGCVSCWIRAAGVSGVVIESVAAASVADRAGLRAGDMVIELNRILVTSVAECAEPPTQG